MRNFIRSTATDLGSDRTLVYRVTLEGDVNVNLNILFSIVGKDHGKCIIIYGGEIVYENTIPLHMLSNQLLEIMTVVKDTYLKDNIILSEDATTNLLVYISSCVGNCILRNGKLSTNHFDYNADAVIMIEEQKSIEKVLTTLDGREQTIDRYSKYGFKTPKHEGELVDSLVNGGYIGYVIHKGIKRWVCYNSTGDCFDIYANSSQLIKWSRYNLTRTDRQIIRTTENTDIEDIEKIDDREFLKLIVGKNYTHGGIGVPQECDLEVIIPIRKNKDLPISMVSNKKRKE